MYLFFILASVALATSPGLELVKIAADANLPESQRQSAFDEAVLRGNVQEMIDFSCDEKSNARERWVAIRVLGKMRAPLATQALVTLLSDDMPAIRAAAAAALGDTRDPAVVEKVAEKLEDPAVIVRASAARSLGVLGDPRAVPYLERALSDPSNSYRGTSLWVRRYYIEALSEIGTKSALNVIAANLDDPDVNVVDAAIRAMEKAAGFSYSEGRSRAEQQAAWERWWANQR